MKLIQSSEENNILYVVFPFTRDSQSASVHLYAPFEWWQTLAIVSSASCRRPIVCVFEWEIFANKIDLQQNYDRENYETETEKWKKHQPINFSFTIAWWN